MMDDKILTDKQIKDMLADKKTFSDLKQIGFIRDEIWLLHRKIEKLEYKERVISADIQKKHGLDFGGYIGVVLAADVIHEAYIKRKMKEKPKKEKERV